MGAMVRLYIFSEMEALIFERMRAVERHEQACVVEGLELHDFCRCQRLTAGLWRTHCTHSKFGSRMFLLNSVNLVQEAPVLFKLCKN